MFYFILARIWVRLEMDGIMTNGILAGKPALACDPAPDGAMAADPGLKFDLLPAEIRRSERFGGVAAARLAEALALRREIDAVAGRLASWVASGRAAVGDEDAILQACWVHLRRAGLALRAEIDLQEINQPASNSASAGRMPSIVAAGNRIDAAARAIAADQTGASTGASA